MPPQLMSSLAAPTSREMMNTNMESPKEQAIELVKCEPESIESIEPRDNDVLCGRGGSINTHPGNARFRELVEKRKRSYIDARFKREKRLIAESILKDIRRLSPSGRFLTRAVKGGPWVEISEEKARDKTSQALRENAPKIRIQIQNERSRYEVQQHHLSTPPPAYDSRNEQRQQYQGTQNSYFRGATSCFNPQMNMSDGGNGPSYNYSNFVETMSDKFGCPASLNDITDSRVTDLRQQDQYRNSRDEYYNYEPNPYGHPTPRRESFNEQVQPSNSYQRNNVVGHRNDQIEYEPDPYGKPTPRRANYSERYPENQSSGRYANIPVIPQTLYNPSNDYSENLDPTPYDDDLASSSWNQETYGASSHEEVLALMDSLSMEDSDRCMSPDIRTPPPEEVTTAAPKEEASPQHDDNSRWQVQGCNFQFTDIVSSVFYGDENSPIHSIDMDDANEVASTSTRSLNGASLVNVFEDSTRNMKDSMMSMGESFFGSMNMSFSATNLNLDGVDLGVDDL
uniref:DUF6824 domain-containing protein n=1 Tax=Chaetoceros debilis TaxID=122233 RepID=A0A7S3Q1V0_9STRA